MSSLVRVHICPSRSPVGGVRWDPPHPIPLLFSVGYIAGDEDAPVEGAFDQRVDLLLVLRVPESQSVEHGGYIPSCIGGGDMGKVRRRIHDHAESLTGCKRGTRIEHDRWVHLRTLHWLRDSHSNLFPLFIWTMSMGEN